MPAPRLPAGPPLPAADLNGLVDHLPAAVSVLHHGAALHAEEVSPDLGRRARSLLLLTLWLGVAIGSGLRPAEAVGVTPAECADAMVDLDAPVRPPPPSLLPPLALPGFLQEVGFIITAGIFIYGRRTMRRGRGRAAGRK